MTKTYKKVTVRIAGEATGRDDVTKVDTVFFDASVVYGKNKSLVTIRSKVIDQIVTFKSSSDAIEVYNDLSDEDKTITELDGDTLTFKYVFKHDASVEVEVDSIIATEDY